VLETSNAFRFVTFGGSSAYPLAKMSSKTAESLGKDDNERVRYIRLDTGKLNFGLPDGEAAWFRMESVRIPNGDYVGVPLPVNLKPLFDQVKKKDGRMKWTATGVAESIHRLINKDETPLSEIKPKFMQENDIKRTAAMDAIGNLSYDKSNPTRIKVNGTLFDYWLSKAYSNAPLVVHRQEL